MFQGRGLENFIQDIRDAKGKEGEQQRVQRELANIREKFTVRAESLNSYQRKKYIWKLVYIYMLGYEIDFGDAQIVALMQSESYSEKHCGYVAFTLMLPPHSECMGAALNAMRRDIACGLNEFQCLALTAIANQGGANLMSLSPEIRQIMSTPACHVHVKKKAAICLMRVIRETPDSIVASEWVSKIGELMTENHLGVQLSAANLLNAMARTHSAHFDSLIQYVTHALQRLVIHKTCAPEYLYFDIACPWLQVKLLQALQNFAPPADSSTRTQLEDILHRIITGTRPSESVNKSNAEHSIMIEAINVVIAHGMDTYPTLAQEIVTHLGRFIRVPEPNPRYLGLATMVRLAKACGKSYIKNHREAVMDSIKDADISIRRRALDLIFVLCDSESAASIVGRLITYLPASAVEIREEMVLKIAILAEKFTTDLRWYVDTVLSLIQIAGSHVADEVWFRIIQIVTNNKDLQKYATEQLFPSLQDPHAHETAICMAAYLVGEFGFLICENDGMYPDDQFTALQAQFASVNSNARGIILSAMAKMTNVFEDYRPAIVEFLRKHSGAEDIELQQRALEYSTLPSLGSEWLEEVLREMPHYSMDRESPLEARLRAGSTDAALNGGAALPPVGENGSGGANENGSGDSVGTGNFGSEPALLDLGIAETPAPANGVATHVTVSDEAASGGQLRAWFTNACRMNGGVLYQDSYVQILSKVQLKPPRAQIALLVKNLTSSPMENLAISVPSVPYLATQVEKVASTVDANGQLQVRMVADSKEPFAAPPEFTVSYSCAGRAHEYPLRFPITAASFMAPIELTTDVFRSKWAELTGEGKDSVAVVESAVPVNLQALSDLKSTLSEALHMKVIDGLYDDPRIFSLAGGFRLPNSVVGCLMSVRAKDGESYDVAIRTLHPKCTAALSSMVKLLMR